MLGLWITYLSLCLHYDFLDDRLIFPQVQVVNLSQSESESSNQQWSIAAGDADPVE